ncbi:MAG: response regulator [Candidatus Zixiibacteriota bacterium]
MKNASSTKPRILIVDDDHDFTSDMKVFLSSDFEIDIASGTREAKRLLNDLTPECILLDMHMPEYLGDNPEMEGIFFLDSITEQHGDSFISAVPVLILSSFTKELTDRTHYLSIIDGLYEKPPNIDTLKQAIWEAISQRRKGNTKTVN